MILAAHASKFLHDVKTYLLCPNIYTVLYLTIVICYKATPLEFHAGLELAMLTRPASSSQTSCVSLSGSQACVTMSDSNKYLTDILANYWLQEWDKINHSNTLFTGPQHHRNIPSSLLENCFQGDLNCRELKCLLAKNSLTQAKNGWNGTVLF